MTTNSNVPQDKDSWADLAQNLFGIEFSNPQDADELISDEDLDLDEPTGISEAATSADSVPEEAGQPVVESSFEIDAGDEAVAEIVDVDIVAAETEESIEIVTTDGPDGSSEPVPAAEEEDTYWNALESWNWSEESEEAQPSSSRSGRSRTSRRAPRQERAQSPGSTPSRSSPTPKESPSEPPPTIVSREEYLDDSGFGAGILDEFSVDSSASSVSGSETGEIDTESAPVSDVSEADKGDRPTRKRRRRRRRRPRRDEGEPTEGAPSETSLIENELPVEESSEETPGSEPSATDSTAQAEKPAPRRRSSGRRRGSRGPKSDSAETPLDETPEDLAKDEATQTELPPDDDEQATSPKRKSSSYKDIPTWEDAISCLLQANQAVSRSSDPASGPSGKTKRDSPRRSGRRRRSRS